MTEYSQKVVFKTSSGNEIVLVVPLRTDLEIKPTSELNLFKRNTQKDKTHWSLSNSLTLLMEFVVQMKLKM